MKRLIPTLIFLPLACFSAVEQPMLGGTGISNNNANTITTTAPVNLPDDINLQNAYNNSGDGTLDLTNFGGLNLINGNLEVNSVGNYSVGVLQVDSTVGGFMPPRMTQTQRDAIYLGENPVGLHIYNTTTNTEDYYNGLDWQNVLTAQNILAGPNVTVTDSNGVVTISASGGSSAPTASTASFSTQNNSTATTFAAMNSFYPVYLGTSFSGSQSSDFTPQFLSISGVSTPVMTYTSATSQTFVFSIGVSARGAVATNSTYKACAFIRQASGTLVNTQSCQLLSLNDLINFYAIPVITGTVTLNQGDAIFAEISNITNTNSVYLAYSNYSTVNVAGSIASTDGLPQGSTNLYGSINGGTSWQNVSGSVTAGHIATFANTNGQIQDGGVINTAATKFASDNTKSMVSSVSGATVAGNLLKAADTQGTVQDSGIATSSVVTSSSAAGGDLTGTYPNPTLATVNSNTGNFGDATHTNTLTLDAKGRVTAASTNLITPAGIGAPTTTGTGASGTWGITATNATNAANIFVNAPITTNANFYIPLTATTGAYGSNWPASTSSNLLFNPSTGALTTTKQIATGFYANTAANAQAIGLNGGNISFLTTPSSSDSNHFLGYYGSSQSKTFGTLTNVDGPVLAGFTSGVLGITNGNIAALQWTNTGVTLAGNLTLSTAGKTASIKSGSNACVGTQALSGSTTTVNTSCAATGDLIFFTITSVGGTPGVYSYTISNGVSFTITSSQGSSDTSTVGWWDVKKT
jgi:hypothetical protein